MNVQMQRPRQGERFEYRTLSLDVPGEKHPPYKADRQDRMLILRKGHPTIYLRNADAEAQKAKPTGLRFLGFEWK